MQIDGKLFIDLLQRTSPGAVQLARLVSLAGRIEPELLRAMRLHHLPDIDAGAEADLWFSPLVQASNPLGLILRPEVLNELRQELAKEENRGLLDVAWETLQNIHKYAPPAIRLEEVVTYLSLKGVSQKEIDGAIMPAVAALCEQKRMGIANWARHVLPRLPEIARSTVAAQILDVQAAILLRRRFLLGNPSSEAINFIKRLPTNYIGRVSIGVRLLEHQGRAKWEFSHPPKIQSLSIEAPNRDPIIVEMMWNTVFSDREETKLILLPLNNSITVLHPGVQITLRTGIGESYEFKIPERHIFKNLMKQIGNRISLNNNNDNNQDRIKKFLEPLDLGYFGNPVGWKWESFKFPIWIIGKMLKYQEENGENKRYTSEVELHKVAYFINYYKLGNLPEFVYAAIPFGPYSIELSKIMDHLVENEIAKKIKHDGQEIIGYELSPKGIAIFQHLDIEMKDKLGSKEKSLVDDILKYLYSAETDLIIDSAKWHYIGTIWAPYTNSYWDADMDLEVSLDTDAYINSLIQMMKDPELASICYMECYEIDHSNSIKLMGEYIKSSSQLERYTRIEPLKELFSKDWFLDIFKENVSFFSNDVLPLILNLDWLEDLHRLGVQLSFFDFDGRRKTQIFFKNRTESILLSPNIDQLINYISKKSERHYRPTDPLSSVVIEPHEEDNPDLKEKSLQYLKSLDTRLSLPDMSIIGRENEVYDFSRRLHDFDREQAISDNVLLICIWGFGGVGKTTLLKKFGEICDADKWFITGMLKNNSTIQTPHPAEPLSAFLSRIHRFTNEHRANAFEVISRFVSSLPSRSALLIDEFRSDDKDFVNSFEWMISQMATQTNHRYLIITTCRPRPRFQSAQVDYYIGTDHGLPPLTLEKTQEYLDLYWEGDSRNKHINEIFDITHGNPKVINYFYASPEISAKILSHIGSSPLDRMDVIRATWEYVHEDENLRRVADLAAIVGMISIACPNDIFDQMIENWHELKRAMLDRSLLEKVGPDTYKMHDLLREYYYKQMRKADKQQQHQNVGKYYEIRNQPVEALEHYVQAKDKKSIQRIYREAYEVMERNSDYKSVIRLVGTHIDNFGAKDEFSINIVTDLGMSYRILTDYQSALSAFEQALSICNLLDVPENSSKRAQIFWGLGETYRRLDRYKLSLEFYDKCLAIYRTHENDDGKDGIARSERGKSAVYKMISRYQESIQGYIAAGNLYRSLDHLDGQLYCERGIAAVYMLQGLYIQAREGYAHSLDLYRKTRDPRGIAYACWGYAESLRLQGEIEAAIVIYNEALDLSKKIGDEWCVIYLSFNLGECYRAKRDFDKARKWHNLTKKLGTYQNSPVLQAHYLLATAELQRLEGKSDLELYRQAEKMYHEVPMGLRWGIAHSKIGLCLAELKILNDGNESQWKDQMNSIVEYCVQNQLPDELETAKRIMEEQNPDELHPLSFP